MFCVLLGQITRCCANRFQDFPFSLASICILSFMSTKSDRLMQIVMRLVGLDNGKPRRCYYSLV